MSEELKSNENVGAPQPDALAQIASVDPSPTVGGMHPFTPAMLSRLKKQRQLLSELEHALKNHEFCFFLQPKCNSMTRAIVGMEALVRWNHPTRGCVPPSEFMPLLESTGLVTQLDQYIWESVCKTLHKWQEKRQQSCACICERFCGGYRQSGRAADLLQPCGKVSAGAQAPAG